eukprot:1153035-Pelagomonas_calceolata.AAC.3
MGALAQWPAQQTAQRIAWGQGWAETLGERAEGAGWAGGRNEAEEGRLWNGLPCCWGPYTPGGSQPG